MVPSELGSPLLSRTSHGFAESSPRRIPDHVLARLKLQSSMVGFLLGGLAPIIAMASVLTTVRMGIHFHWKVESPSMEPMMDILVGLLVGLLVTLIVFSLEYFFLRRALKQWHSQADCNMQSVIEVLLVQSSPATFAGIFISSHAIFYGMGIPFWNGMMVAMSGLCAIYSIYSVWCNTTLSSEELFREEEVNTSKDEGLGSIVIV